MADISSDISRRGSDHAANITVQDEDLAFRLRSDAIWAGVFSRQDELGFKILPAEVNGEPLNNGQLEQAGQILANNADDVIEAMSEVFAVRIARTDRDGTDSINRDDLRRVRASINLPEDVTGTPDENTILNALAMRAFYDAVEDLGNDTRKHGRNTLTAANNIKADVQAEYLETLQDDLARADAILAKAGTQANTPTEPAENLVTLYNRLVDVGENDKTGGTIPIADVRAAAKTFRENGDAFSEGASEDMRKAVAAYLTFYDADGDGEMSAAREDARELDTTNETYQSILAAPTITPDMDAEINIETGDITIIIAPTFNINNITVENLGPVINNAIIAHCRGEDGEVDQDKLDRLLGQHNDADGAAITIIQNDIDVTVVDIDVNQLVIQQITVIQGDVNVEAGTDADAAEAEETAEAAVDTPTRTEPTRGAEHWFYRGNSSDEIAALQQALGVDEAYRTRLGDGWADWADGLIGSRTEAVINDYAGKHGINPRTMSLQEFTDHVRENLTADAAVTATAEVVETREETIVEAAERAAAEAAAEATVGAAETAILTDDDRVLDVDALDDGRKVLERWQADNPGVAFPSGGILSTFDTGLGDGRDPMLVFADAEGNPIVIQLHAENYQALINTQTFIDSHLEDKVIDDRDDYHQRRSSFPERADYGGVEFNVDRNTGVIDFNRVFIDGGQDGKFVSTLVTDENGSRMVEKDELTDALGDFDSSSEIKDVMADADKSLRQVWAAQVDRLQDVLENTSGTNLNVSFSGAGADSTAEISTSTGETIEIPKTLYDAIMDAADTRDAPAVEVAAKVEPPTLTG